MSGHIHPAIVVRMEGIQNTHSERLQRQGRTIPTPGARGMMRKVERLELGSGLTSRQEASVIVPATPWAATRAAPTMGIVVDGICRGIPLWVPLAGWPER